MKVGNQDILKTQEEPEFGFEDSGTPQISFVLGPDFAWNFPKKSIGETRNRCFDPNLDQNPKLQQLVLAP